MRAHVEETVRRRVALNAVKALSDPARLAIDLARMGCGDPMRHKLAQVARKVADVADQPGAPGEAGAEALRDLAYVLERGDSEDCARGVGTLWQKLAPFRAATRGAEPVDRYDLRSIYRGQLTRAGAIRALDHAAHLAAPPVAVMKLARDVEAVLAVDVDALIKVEIEEAFSVAPFTVPLARALIVEARDALERTKLYDAAGIERIRGGEYRCVAKHVLDTADAWLNELQTGATPSWNEYDFVVKLTELHGELDQRLDDLMQARVAMLKPPAPGLRWSKDRPQLIAENEYELAEAQRVVDAATVVRRAVSYLDDASKRLEELRDVERRIRERREGQHPWTVDQSEHLQRLNAKRESLRAHFPDLYPESR